MIRPKPDVPERVPVISFPTPEGQSDLLFYEIRDGDVPKNKLWSYGDAHPDAAKFPNHELVFVAAEGGAGWQRWYYAANRENQHLYNWQFTDTGEQVLLNLENSALTHRQGQQHTQADATVRLARSTLDQISMQRLSFADAFQAGQIAVDGNGAALMDLMAMIDNFSRMFPIVGPRPDSVRPAA